MVQSKNVLPQRVVDYIHEMGVRALDHLADQVDAPTPAKSKTAEESPSPGAVQALVDRWKSMAMDDKEEFVERVAASVIEVVAASAALPIGLKLGRQAARATRKVLKRRTRKLRKLAKRAVARKPKQKADSKKTKGPDLGKTKDKAKKKTRS